MTVQGAVLSFALVAGLLTITPGLDTALVLRSAVAHGARHAFATALGINTGTLIWGAGAAVGVSALLTASTTAYTAVRLAGATYMIWLGSKILWTALRDRGDGGMAAPTGSAAAVSTVSVWRSYNRGLLTNLLNPKIGAFYVAVLPAFIPEDTSHLAVGLLLAMVHNVEGLVWFTAIILGAGQVRSWLARRSVKRATDALTGATLVGFGLKLGVLPR